MVGFARKCAISILVTVGLTGMALGQEIPGLTKSEYDITLDSSWEISGGGGDGFAGTWFYYPESDRYIMWFDNGDYDPTRQGEMEIWAFIKVADPGKFLSVSVGYGWTKPAWSAISGGPPLPEDLDTLDKEFQYLDETTLISMSNVVFGETTSSEPSDSETVDDYSPAWFFVTVSGRNVNVFRHMFHGSTGNGVDPPTTEPPATAACCNPQTGQCFLVNSTVCVFPFINLGAGSSCASCVTANFTWDYGDAPASYSVLSSQNGARHVVSTGVALGAGVTKDPDGRPSAAANLDDFDDGVVFRSQIIVGQIATVDVTTTTSGVINAWLDLNVDGDWRDVGEQIIVDQPVVGGTTSLNFPVSSVAIPGQSYARFRFNTAGGLTHSGEAADGEVEDYAVTILSGGGGGPVVPPPTPTAATKSPSSKFTTLFSQPADVAGAGRIGGWGIPSDYALGPIMAGDFTTSGGKSIQGIRWWGLFANWTQPVPPSQLPSAFHIGIWSNNPAGQLPGTLIYETQVSCWSWAFSGVLLDARGQTGVESVFEFTAMLSQDRWFQPNTAANTKYWISIAAIYSGGQATQPFSWMTRKNQGTLAGVVIQQIGSTLPGQIGQWPPVVGDVFQTGAPVNFPGGVPWDMSFELISSGSGGGGIAPGGDLNGDGVVDVQDVSILMGLWLD